MRLFFVFENDRLQLDIDNNETVHQVKETIRRTLRLSSDEGSAGFESHERKILSLSFAGATLDESWRLADIGISSGAQLKVFFREETNPSFMLYKRFNDQTTPVYRPINFHTASGGDLRAIVSRVSGLPVGVFRLTNESGTEVYDCHTLDRYGLELGCVVCMETWDGWNELLAAAVGGFTRQVMDNCDVIDEAVAAFQLRSALYIAAHFGHVDLAVSITSSGVRCDDPVGEHPTRAWAGRDSRHVDCYKTPIHEAVEHGQLAVLRYFVHQDVCSVLARDGNNLTPLNIALRNKQQTCAQFLLTKQWSKISYGKKGTVSLTSYVRMKRWADVARDRVLTLYGTAKSSVRHAAQCRNNAETTLLGHGVQLDGFTPSMMTSKPTSQSSVIEAKKKSRPTATNPELYFKTFVANSNTMATAARQQHQRRGGNDVINGSGDVTLSGEATPGGGGATHRLRLPAIDMQQVNVVISRSRDLQSPDDVMMSRSKHAGSIFALTGGGSLDQDTLSDMEQLESIDSQTTNRKKNKKSNKNMLRNDDDVIDDDTDPVGDDVINKSSNISRQNQRRPAAVATSLNLGSELRLPAVSSSTGPDLQCYEEALSTRREFERERGMTSRDYAIRCLSLAQRFTDRPWLHQVRQAVGMATAGVKRVYGNEPHLFSDDTRTDRRPAVYSQHCK